MYDALTSKDNPKPLDKSHFALAIGVQAFCLGGAGIYTAPSMEGPWTFRGSLFSQLSPEPDVRGVAHSASMFLSCVGRYVVQGLKVNASIGMVGCGVGVCASCISCTSGGKLPVNWA